MLLNFKVKNYLSFKDEAGFSLEANKKIRALPQNKNIIKLKDGETVRLNKTAVFYGANASGKTNIFKGLDFLREVITRSAKFDSNGGIKSELPTRVKFDNFLLDEEQKNNFSDFEVEFLIDKIKYRYFLRLNEKEILKEKLSFFNKNKEIIILNRQITKWELKEDYFGFDNDDFAKLNLFPRYNQTFISIFSDRETGEYIFSSDNKMKKRKKNIGLSTKILNFFYEIHFISSKGNYSPFTSRMLKDENFKNTILSFINNADINVKDINIEERETDLSDDNSNSFIDSDGQKKFLRRVIEPKMDFMHPIYKEGKEVGHRAFDFMSQESQGTKTLFSFLGPILDTIKKNGTLLIDEVDTHMHFLLIENLINFLHGLNEDGKNNIGNSQFVFNTHNLDLMDLELFRKDQIFFTSKDYYGATEIYSLDDFKDIQIRNNSDIKKAYKLGAFGAIPILSDFNL